MRGFLVALFSSNINECFRAVLFFYEKISHAQIAQKTKTKQNKKVFLCA